jgi:predicted transcriptional regulator
MALGKMFSIRLEEDLLTKVEKAAESIDRSKNWTITAILAKYFQEENEPEKLVSFILAQKKAK